MVDKKNKVEMYNVPDKLKGKLGLRAAEFKDEPGYIDPELIKEADSLIDELREECPEKMAGILDEVVKLWDTMKDMPRSDERNNISQEIYILSHEIKDLGALCGHDLAAFFAESLRDYITKTELKIEAQRVIIQAHVDALKVVLLKELKENEGAAAEELKTVVKMAIEKFS